jgi:hypothetical protein
VRVRLMTLNHDHELKNTRNQSDSGHVRVVQRR